MRQAVSAETKAGWGVEPASLLDARPELPERAELGDGEELVLVGGEPEIDQAARVVERHAALLERAEIGDGDCEREGKLLRLRAACGMDGPAIGDGEGSGEALAREIGDERGQAARDVFPGERARSRQGDAR